MHLNNHERAMLVRYYAERAIEVLDDGPHHENGGWVAMMACVRELLERGAMFSELNSDD